jgi:Ca2+-binding EF-hand superfamily protein
MINTKYFLLGILSLAMILMIVSVSADITIKDSEGLKLGSETFLDAGNNNITNVNSLYARNIGLKYTGESPKDVFEKIDQNGDGELELRELGTAIQDYQNDEVNLEINDLARGIQWYQSNVDKSELNDPEGKVKIATLSKQGDLAVPGDLIVHGSYKIRAESQKTVFDKIDQNGDGELELGELGDSIQQYQSGGRTDIKLSDLSKGIEWYQNDIERNELSSIPKFTKIATLTPEGNMGVPGEISVDKISPYYLSDSVNLEGNLNLTGNDIVGVGKIEKDTNNFVQAINSTHEAIYTSQESPKPRAVYENQATLTGGQKIVDLPNHFTQVVSKESPNLNIQVTPRKLANVAVVRRSTDRIKIVADKKSEFKVDYRVTGVREGYEDSDATRLK